jgi:hypothetical protein
MVLNPISPSLTLHCCLGDDVSPMKWSQNSGLAILKLILEFFEKKLFKKNRFFVWDPYFHKNPKSKICYAKWTLRIEVVIVFSEFIL